VARSAPYDAHSGRNDRWFPHHEAAYLSELLAVRALLPVEGKGLEIGVGTGRFAAPLGIEIGLDPAAAMLARARQRGIRVVQGIAEALPFADHCFDYALMVVVLSFLGDAAAGLAEIRRVLNPGGSLVIGSIDKDSPSGRAYLARRAHRLFFREATFYGADEAAGLLAAAGFHDLCWVQTLTEPPEDMTWIEPLRPGHGSGAFVVVRAARG
jgi:SAM-dependent methyltransferase